MGDQNLHRAGVAQMWFRTAFVLLAVAFVAAAATDHNVIPEEFLVQSLQVDNREQTEAELKESRFPLTVSPLENFDADGADALSGTKESVTDDVQLFAWGSTVARKLWKKWLKAHSDAKHSRRKMTS